MARKRLETNGRLIVDCNRNDILQMGKNRIIP